MKQMTMTFYVKLSVIFQYISFNTRDKEALQSV